MIFFLLIIILLQIGITFKLAQRNTVIKEELAKERLIVEAKENQIHKLQNAIKAHEQKLEKAKKDLLSIKDFDNLHNEVEFPVAEMEDGTGLLISRRCKNDCIIESFVFPNYDMGIIISKALTIMGFKMEKEYCIDCKRDGSAKED